ncbi:MAG: PorP/SprF family type IX secretion system membrane protein [Sphingobacteriaceae bacterium]|nr:PorP/SprF family type IX secretion system membrane protein [Sphingobacteriaceae bacterium]
MKKLSAIVLVVVSMIGLSVKAQHYTLVSQYFINPYLSNPALAGASEGLNLNMVHRQQRKIFKGAPVAQSLTADYALNRKMGLGINMYLDKAGLQRDVRFLASYAYHLQLIAEQKLHFGMSFGFSNQSLSSQEIIGNVGSASMANYKKNYFDGDVGIGYESNELKAEVVIPNMKTFLNKNKNVSDVSLFYGSVSYKTMARGNSEDVFVESKLAYRSIKGYDDIVDFGVEASILQQQLQFMAMYHSSKNMSFGLSYKYKDIYVLNTIYTSASNGLTEYVNGMFEVGIKVHLSLINNNVCRLVY